MPDHREGDLLIGLCRSAIGTLVERSTRYTMLLHLPPMEGHGQAPRVHNGPALAGHGESHWVLWRLGLLVSNQCVVGLLGTA